MPRYPSELGPFIEATLLNPHAGHVEIRAFVQEAIRHRVAAVCVLPYWLPLVTDLVAPHNIPVATVVSYPHGLEHLRSKLGMVQVAADLGANEVNVYLNPVHVDSRSWNLVREEMVRLVEYLPHLTIKAVVNCANLMSSQFSTLMAEAHNAQVDYVAIHANGDIPQRDDIQNAYYAAPGQVRVMALGNYLGNLAALRAVNSGASRISTQFPARLIGTP